MPHNEKSLLKLFEMNFLGRSPTWYKRLILFFLIINPILLLFSGKFIAGWAILAEFIFTLAFSLTCYPLLPGGLIAIESVFMGMTNGKLIYHEIEQNLEVILLLIFMVAGIYFMKDFLTWAFTKLLFITKSKIGISLIFCISGAFLSAWLDALTVIAVIIAVTVGFYDIYEKVSYEDRITENISYSEKEILIKEDINNFEGFLRNLLMYTAIGTAIGGTSTIVGEPQNLIIGNTMQWNFAQFFLKMSHVSIPVIIAGLITVILTEKFKILGYGYEIPVRVKNILLNDMQEKSKRKTKNDYLRLFLQGSVAIWLIVALAFHLAPVGLVGVSVIIFLTSFLGQTTEHKIGKAFEESLPFTSLLIVFFAIVSLIQNHNLFQPIINYALAQKGNDQVLAFFFASGVLSAISDNVFVATIYIQEASKAFQNNLITKDQLESLAIAINVGSNIPSIATPNGQAAFLFLLTSPIAQRIELSYTSMLKLAFPYTIILTLTSLYFLNKGS